MDTDKIIQSTKWSALTELLSKITAPLSNIVLARLLQPEVFGVVATLTMVATFAEIFTDAGFQKYLIQHEFKNDEEKKQYANVAFWTNFFVSVMVWAGICFTRDRIASFAGSEGYGLEVAVLSIQIPLAAVSSIQQALYRREFRFRELMPLRLAVSLVPLLVTVPLAFVFHSCWAIIIGTLVREIVFAALLTWKSAWRPALYYDLHKLKNILGQSLWLMMDSVVIWFTVYIDTFIVSRYLTSHYIGIYKQGATAIAPYMTLLYTMTAPVLFSVVSRLQDKKEECDRVLMSFQKYGAYLVLPLGCGVLIFHDLITMILLGRNFMEASLLLGLQGFAYSVNLFTGRYNSDYYRGIGKPKTALSVQAAYTAVIFAGLSAAVRQSFEFLCIARGLISFSYAVISCSVLCIRFKIRIADIVKNLLPAGISMTGMTVAGVLLKSMSEGMVWQFFSLASSVIIYCLILASFPGTRKDIGTLTMLLRRDAR